MLQKAVSVTAVLVVLAAVGEAATQGKATQAGCSLTIQFDNSLNSVQNRKNDQIMKVLADKVFLVPENQVAPVGGISQSGILTRQATVTYFARGPTTNGADVCENCKKNTAGRWLGLRSSVLGSEIGKATDTWWPGDKADVQKAQCTPA